jgi:hypothetical protein
MYPYKGDGPKSAPLVVAGIEFNLKLDRQIDDDDSFVRWYSYSVRYQRVDRSVASIIRARVYAVAFLLGEVKTERLHDAMNSDIVTFSPVPELETSNHASSTTSLFQMEEWKVTRQNSLYCPFTSNIACRMFGYNVTIQFIDIE